MAQRVLVQGGTVGPGMGADMERRAARTRELRGLGCTTEPGNQRYGRGYSFVIVPAGLEVTPDEVADLGGAAYGWGGTVEWREGRDDGSARYCVAVYTD